jgi:hypothetical protein
LLVTKDLSLNQALCGFAVSVQDQQVFVLVHCLRP